MKRPSVKQNMKWQVSSNFQIYPSKSDDPPVSKSHTFSTALHCIQLYMLSSFMCCHLELSCWTGQSYIYFFSKFLSIYSSCCAFDCILLLLCKMHNNNKKRLIYRSLVSYIKRLIVKEITVTARYSAMPDLSLYIYI